MFKSTSLRLTNALANIKDKSLIKSEQAELNIAPVHHVNVDYERAIFGMGCFWAGESLFGATRGVLRTKVGYSAGTTQSPTYKSLPRNCISSGDYVEVVVIDFDPKTITFDDLLQLFWNNHEYGLTTKQKRQYISLILYQSDEQRKIAKKSMELEQPRRIPEIITTQIIETSEFHPAEDYHQKYRLQSHKELTESLDMTPELLQTSYVATKLNGYLVGNGGVQQFLKEADSLGLTPSQKEYVRHHVEKNEGGSLFC